MSDTAKFKVGDIVRLPARDVRVVVEVSYHPDIWGYYYKFERFNSFMGCHAPLAEGVEWIDPRAVKSALLNELKCSFNELRVFLQGKELHWYKHLLEADHWGYKHKSIKQLTDFYLENKKVDE